MRGFKLGTGTDGGEETALRWVLGPQVAGFSIGKAK